MKHEITPVEDPSVELCTFVAPGVPHLEHDYRPFVWAPPGDRRLHPITVLRCVHCHVVACGRATETDPCIEPLRHKGHHRTVLGVRWPANRPRPKRSVPWPAREDV